MLFVIFILFILIFYLNWIKLYKKTKSVGYLSGQNINMESSENTKSNKIKDKIHSKIRYLILSNKDFDNKEMFNKIELSLKKSGLSKSKDKIFICYAQLEDDIIGSLVLYECKPNRSTSFFVANDLNVNLEYRNLGIANYIIRKIGYQLINNGYFGIFSTSHTLPLKKIFTVYWLKYSAKTNSTKSK